MTVQKKIIYQFFKFRGWMKTFQAVIGQGFIPDRLPSTKGVKFRELFMLTSTSTPTASFKGFAYLSENRKLI